MGEEDPAAGPGLTEAVATFSTAPLPDGLPDDVTDVCLRSLVDTVGVIVAGGRDPAVALVRAALTSGTTGPASILVDGTTANAAEAALLHGVAGHALDFDDVNDLMYGHPSVVLWPAVLAVGEERGASGAALLEAFAVGFQVLTTLAAGMDVREHYGRGWHSTSTLGVVAATASVARLRGLDVATTRRALGLAASMAGGSRQNFGTMTKPLHPGLAARDAVLAADLAARGFTADSSVLEAPLGYYRMFTQRCDVEAAQRELESPWSVLRDGINVKKYACCFNTHRTADATLQLVGEHRLVPEDVISVSLTMEPGGFDPLIHHRPATGLQGKFSGEYVVAAALLDRRITLATFTDEAVNRDEARRLVARVETHEAAIPPEGPAAWDHAYSVVAVTTPEGTVSRRCDIPRGDRRLPLDRDGLEAKLRDCVLYSGTCWDADTLLAQLWGLAGEPVFKGFSAAGTGEG